MLSILFSGLKKLFYTSFALSLLSATIINVPADIDSIQGGINLAFNGDTVLVQPGTYVENINFLGKNITVGSLILTTGETSYISQTIIDGDSSGSVVTFNGGEDSTAVLNGFTLQGGLAFSGGGIYCGDSTNPAILNMIIKGNRGYVGAGIYCGGNSNPVFMNVSVHDNEARCREGGIGGGIYCDRNSKPTLINSIINRNTALFPNLPIVNRDIVEGGGIFCDSADVTLENVTISDNDAGGIYSVNGSNISVINSIIWYNSGNQIHCRDSSTTITIGYSNIDGGVDQIIIDDGGTVNWLDGNINALPLFCNPDSGVYTLAANSPCVGTGENGSNMGALGVGCGPILNLDGKVLIPDKFALHQNYPNPFNPTTAIHYELSERSDVQITIFDLVGREVTALFSETQDAGYKSIQWDASNVSSGMYFYQIRAGEFVQTRKMVVLK